VRRLIPWALVGVLSVCAVGTVVFTETRKAPATPPTLKAAQLLPSDLGAGWKLVGVRAAVAPVTGGSPTCPGFGTLFGGPFSQALFSKNTRGEPSTLEVTILQPSTDAQAVFEMVVRCGLTKVAPGPPGHRSFRLVQPYPTSAFDGLAQRSAGGTALLGDGTDHRSDFGWFVQGNNFVAVAYLGPAPLSEVRQWAADAIDKAAANS
jgi:hypothetical protein